MSKHVRMVVLYSAVPLKRGQFSHKYSRKTPQSSAVRVSYGEFLWIQFLIDILPQ